MNASMFSFAGGGNGPRITTLTSLLAKECDGFVDRTCVPETVGDDVVDWALGSAEAAI